MAITIHSALHARQVSYKFEKQLSKYRYNEDLVKLLENIDVMITELSKEEVIVRQTRKDAAYNKKKQEVSEVLDRFEKLLLFLALTE